MYCRNAPTRVAAVRDVGRLRALQFPCVDTVFTAGAYLAVNVTTGQTANYPLNAASRVSRERQSIEKRVAVWRRFDC